MSRQAHQVICMWSGPRNLSTAMMRSFGSRADCVVWDEPFFAPFLKATGIDHPGREETLAAHETNPDIVARRCVMPPKSGAPYFFQKHMPHHMTKGFPMDWTTQCRHFFLIRAPARVIASYAKGRAKFTVDDLGYGPQVKLYDDIATRTGVTPPVVDSDDILCAPEPMLRALCAALSMPFDKNMLSWEAGPRPEDGAWAPYWYASVERSTGFGPPPQIKPHQVLPIPDTPDANMQVPDVYEDIRGRCEADYTRLRARRIRV